MIKILFLFCLILPFYASANETTCLSSESQTQIQNIEKELAKCKVNMPENPSTVDMNNATYNAVDCVTEVAYKIFELYYTENNKTVRKDFDALVKTIYSHSHNLIQSSDVARKFYNGTMYNTIAIGHAHYMIKNIVNEYIQQIKKECTYPHS